MLLLLAILVCCAKTQNLSYLHYTTAEGLAGNTVYDVVQDKDGFIFFATENGLTRYDGKEFITYTIADGLSDNEVLKLFADSKGRVWITCFNKKICYYYEGKIYNTSNAPHLATINKLIIRYIETNDGSIVFCANDEVYMLDNNMISCIMKKDIDLNKHTISVNYYKSTNELIIGYKDSSFKYQNKHLTFSFLCNYEFPSNVLFFSNKPKKFHQGVSNSDIIKIKLPSNHNSIFTINQIAFLVNTNKGCWEIDSVNCSLSYHFLPDKQINNSLYDAEGNYWFATYNDGVYKLNSKAIKTYLPVTNANPSKEILCISSTGSKIYAGSFFGSFISIQDSIKSNFNYQQYINKSTNSKDINRVTCATEIGDHTIVFGLDNYLLKLHNNKPQFNYDVQPVKSLYKINEDILLVATSKTTVTVNANTLAVIDTIFKDRSTAACYANTNYYIGTTNGLISINRAKQQQHLSCIHSILRHRIVAIKADANGTLYIATSDSGLIILNSKHQVEKIITTTQGICSNSCKSLLLHNNFLWVGTINGASKIDLLHNFSVTNYTKSNGLPSDIINAMYIGNDSSIWVGSPEGLTMFKEKSIAQKTICNLIVEQITSGNASLPLNSESYVLKYGGNNITFGYVAVTMRAAENIEYSYYLQGFDTAWQHTRKRNIAYLSLPVGNYTFQLYATNSLGIKSRIYTCKISVQQSFWRSWWFYALSSVVTILFIWLLIYLRYKRIEKVNSQIADFRVQLANMEQQALQAQMNPHFIFNSINAIQQFILSKENEKAFNYLNLFSSLVRNTLDNCDKQYITLENEIDYLQQYLSLEELRFGSVFTYSITIDEAIDTAEIKIPSMILQPFVENALRHGIRQLQEKHGLLNISFEFNGNDKLICTITDNGIGRKAAEEFKSMMQVSYQSKGIELTRKRIELLNNNKDKKISFMIIDLYDEADIANGTKVIVTIPL